MVITHFRTSETHDNQSLNNCSNKAKLRRQRYENTTLNKPCTVRAHPDKHEFIKKYAKTGRCNNCQRLAQRHKDIMAKLAQQMTGPLKWSDEITHRDAILSAFVVIFTLTFVIIYEIAKRVTF